MQRRGARPVQRRPRAPSSRIHRVSTGRPQEGGHRARRHLTVHRHVSGGDQGSRVCVAHPQWPVRGGVPAGAGRNAVGGNAGEGVLRAVRDRLHPRRPGGIDPDTPSQALHRRSALWADGWPRCRCAAIQRQARRGCRLRARRADRRLAAAPQRVSRADLRGRGATGGVPASCDSGIPATTGRGRAGHPECDGHRGRGRHRMHP